MAERRSADPRDRRAEAEDVRRKGAEEAGAVDPTDLAPPPTEPGDLGDQAEGDLLPQTEAPAGGGLDSLGDEETAGMGPSAPERPEGGTTLEDLMNAPDPMMGDGPVGGLDGRQEGSGGGAPSPGGDPDLGSSPVQGALLDESAAGKLPPHQQAVIDDLAAKAQQAAADEDWDAANDYANQAHDFLVEIGQSEPTPPETGGAGEEASTGLSLTSNYGSAGSGTKQVWDNEKGEMVEVTADTKTDHEEFVSETTQMDRTGTSTDSTDDSGGGRPPQGKEGVDDRTAESAFGSEDRWTEFTDDFFEHSRGATAGGDVDPDPNADPAGPAAGAPPDDFTDPVAQYKEGEVAPEYTVDDLPTDTAPPTPDEEFFDL